MTTVNNIAQRILDENGYVLTDFPNLTKTILEYKINDAIDWINMQAGLTIADLAGTAESKSITGTDGQILVVKWLTNLMLKAYKEKGEQAGISSLSVGYVVSDPDYKISMMIIEKAIERLKKLPIVIANAPLPNE
jgi:hypothetical protein